MKSKLATCQKVFMLLAAIAVFEVALPIAREGGLQVAYAQTPSEETETNQNDSRDRRRHPDPFIWGGDGPSRQQQPRQ